MSEPAIYNYSTYNLLGGFNFIFMATDSDSLSSLSLATRGLRTSDSAPKLGESESPFSYKL